MDITIEKLETQCLPNNQGQAIMQVITERLFLETDQAGHLTQMPKLPANARVEAIFIVLEQSIDTKPLRRPHADILGKTRFLGDVFNSVPESDWNLPE